MKFSVSDCIYKNESTKMVSRIQNTLGEKCKLIIDAQFSPWIE